jgi:hypothetical protein
MNRRGVMGWLCSLFIGAVPEVRNRPPQLILYMRNGNQVTYNLAMNLNIREVLTEEQANRVERAKELRVRNGEVYLQISNKASGYC